jgi:hypothetical protein
MAKRGSPVSSRSAKLGCGPARAALTAGPARMTGAAVPWSVAVGNALAGVPPRRSVRAELPNTAPTSAAWRKTARSGQGAGPWDGVSSDRRAAESAPTSSGGADSVAVKRGASFARPPYGMLPELPCCQGLLTSRLTFSRRAFPSPRWHPPCQRPVPTVPRY